MYRNNDMNPTYDFHNLMAPHNKKRADSLVSSLSPSLNWRIMK